MSFSNRLLLPTFGGLLISFLIVCSSGEQYYSYGQTSDTAPQKQESSPWEWRSRIAEPISAPERNPNPNRDEWREEEDLQAQRDVAIWTYRAVVIGIISIVLTALGVYLVWQTLRETRKATEAAVAAAEAIPKLERAHLFFHILLMDWRARSSKETRKSFDDIAVADFLFINHGKTPAIVQSLSARLCASASPPNTIVHDPNVPDVFDIVIEPGEKRRFNPRREIMISEEEADQISTMEKFLWLYGSLVYRDIFGDQHITRFQYKAFGFSREMIAEGREYNERT